MTHWGSRTQHGRFVEQLEERQLLAANACQTTVPTTELAREAPLIQTVEEHTETTYVTIGSNTNGLGYPAPDDDGDWGPIGPVVRDAIRVIARDFAHRMFEDMQVAYRQGGAGMPSPDDDTPWPPWIGPYVHTVDELYIITAMKVVTDNSVNPEPSPWTPDLFHKHVQTQLMNWFGDPDLNPRISPLLAAELGYPVDGSEDPGPDDPQFRDRLRGIAHRYVQRMQEDLQEIYARGGGGGGGVGLPADDDDTEWPPWIGPYVRTADDLYLVVANRAFQQMDADSNLDQLQCYVEEQLLLWFRDPDRELVVQDGAVIDPDAVLEISRRAPGDSNRDGVFDSSDLVMSFQSGEYEDNISNNSKWHEGDWNDDGEFDSSDLVLAFQLGHYENPGHSSPHERVIDLIFADN